MEAKSAHGNGTYHLPGLPLPNTATLFLKLDRQVKLPTHAG